MGKSSDFSSVYGSSFAATLRVIGFFSLIIALVPVQLIIRPFRRIDPYRLPMQFHGILVRILGFRLRVHGTLCTHKPTLYVANHSSYLDVPVLGALIPASFVAKAEVSTWPLIGFLCRLQNTVFIERRATRAVDQSNQLAEILSAGKRLILFPEGTSTEGHYALPFKSSLFSVVEEVQGTPPLLIQPISLTCTEIGGLPILRNWRPLYAWYGDMTFIKHLWEVFKIGDFTVDVTFHPAVNPQDFVDRKALASYCQAEVARGIEAAITGRNKNVPLLTHVKG